jgi:hypothetical protein
MPPIDAAAFRRRLALALSAAALLVAAGCERIESSVKPEPNPLLQSAQGRMDLVQRCNAEAQARMPMARAWVFAAGRVTNVDTSGAAEYLGAVEVTSQANISQRFRYICHVQPDGRLDLQFLPG